MTADDPPTDVDATALSDAEIERLLELTEAVVTGEDLTAESAQELLAILRTAGVDFEGASMDEQTLSTRLHDALGIARLLLEIRSNIATEATRTWMRTGSRMVDSALGSESPREFLDDTVDIARDELARIGLDLPLPVGDGNWDERSDRTGTSRIAELRERGQRLLEQSADVDHEEPAHPAYERIVDELATDEVRILRLLAQEGPQPAVDIRDRGRWFIGSELVAAELTMLCIDAGCRDDDRQGAYVTNLHRLGLIWIADEPLEDLQRYQLLEAQPHIESVKADARRPRAVRRSIHLTPLGTDFCETVLGVELTSNHTTARRVQSTENRSDDG